MAASNGMADKHPNVNVDILIVRGTTVLLGLLTKRWLHEGKQVYGVPGRDIRFGETIGEAVRRFVSDEIGCSTTGYRIISVNANRALGNHYIGIGVVAEIIGEPKLRLPEDWDSWEWFDIDMLPENLFPAARNVIDCYRRHLVCISE